MEEITKAHNGIVGIGKRSGMDMPRQMLGNN
jgi:hypothetical protein